MSARPLLRRGALARSGPAQLRAELTTFVREPADLFFSVALPLLFLVLFASIFGGEPLEEGSDLDAAQVMVPGFVCFALITSGYTSMVINLVGKRERGMLKRARATPAPRATLFVALGGKAVLVGLAASALLVVVGRLAYGVELSPSRLPALLAAVLVGGLAVSCLGVATSVVVPTEGAASAITNAVTLPLLFISGVFIPSEALPGALDTIARLFPVKPLYEALTTVFDPGAGGAGFAPLELAVVALWGLAGLAVALRTFRPFPRRDRE